MQGFGGSCFVSVKTHHSPGISRNLRQGLISWNSPVSLHVCMRLGERGVLCLVCCLRMYLWFHRSRISSYQLAPTGKEFVTSYTPNMRFKAPNIYERNLMFLLSSSIFFSPSLSVFPNVTVWTLVFSYLWWTISLWLCVFYQQGPGQLMGFML